MSSAWWQATATPPARRPETHGGGVLAADIGGEPAAGGEPASRRGRDEAGRGAGDPLQLTGDIVDPGHGGQQSGGVGVAGTAVHVGHRTLLGEPSGVHDHDPVGGAGHHAEVVGDQENRPVEVVADLGEGLQHLRLHGHVQRRGGLVGDQHGRVERHGHGDHHPLAHAAGEFVGERVGAPRRVRDAHEVQ